MTMKNNFTIAVVDDNKNILAALQILLSKHYQSVHTLSSPNSLLSLLQKETVDVVLLDMNFGTGVNNGNEGLYWLSRIKQQDFRLQVVFFTAYAEIDLAVRGIKEGAFDFLEKPWNNDKLLAVLLAAANQTRLLRSKGKQGKDSGQHMPSEMYWGESTAMQQLHELVQRLSGTEANVLITGENGTGKDLLAREIHRMSQRSSYPFLSVDMGAISETLFESELFGYVKGAFTDAKKGHSGKFEAADQGTLFMDEIGNLPLHLQAKLLNVLQNRRVTRLGSNQSIPVNIRLLCATNRNLPQMVKDGEFREDLLYRINTVQLTLPSLRDRVEDIIPLAELFINRYVTLYDAKPITLSNTAKARLRSYKWPGNIRELQHTIERVVIFSGGGELTSDSFSLSHLDEPEEEIIPATELPKTLDDMERIMIASAMKECGGNLSLTASRLGITRQTLYNKLKKYGM